ncbi:MAG: TRAP-type C4-dicarboxylate transport system, large permease component [Firmicutes bacterium]|nr:TRAP-type C4-dicarboxylate transport system, large permease component [Bacillota bacterium]
MTAIILLLVFAVTICLSVPVAAGLGIATAVTLVLDEIPLFMMVQRMMTQINTFTVMAILFFMLSGEIMCKGTMTEKLISWAEALVGHIRGGLAIAGGVAAGFFSALSGSSAATCASIGTIMIGKMEQRGYPRDYSSGVIASSGITGIVIPPSVTLVVYGVVTGTSVRKLFAAGIAPGILMSAAMCVLSYFISKKNNFGQIQEFSLKKLWETTREGIFVLIMPAIVLGGIYGGVFTPNEASVVAAVYAYILTKFKDKALPWKVMKEVLLKSIVNTAVVLFVMQTAAGFSWVLTNARVPHLLGELSASLGDSKVIFLILVNLLLLVTGCLVTGSGAVSILAPILLPVAVGYGIDPIFLGALMIVNLSIGYITPPVGVDLYIAGSIGKVPVENVIKHVMPYLILLLVLLVFITYVPAFTMFLPNLMK